MNFFKYLANEWADVTGLSSSGRQFHRQLPLNMIDLCPRELCVCSRWRCSLVSCPPFYVVHFQCPAIRIYQAQWKYISEADGRQAGCCVEISAVRWDASGLSVWPRYSTNYRLSDWPCVVSGDTVLPDTAAVAERYSIAGVWILFDRCRNASVLKYFVVTVARLSTSRNTRSRRQTSTRTRTDARTLTASTHNALGLIYWLRKTKKYLKHAPKGQ